MNTATTEATRPLDPAIGTLCRNGRTLYYAYINGILTERHTAADLEAMMDAARAQGGTVGAGEWERRQLELSEAAYTAGHYTQAAAYEARATLRLEAYGVKGLASKPWQRTFRDSAALLAWCEKNDATALGFRDVEA